MLWHLSLVGMVKAGCCQALLALMGACRHQPACFCALSPAQMLTFRREQEWQALAQRINLLHKASLPGALALTLRWACVHSCATCVTWCWLRQN